MDIWVNALEPPAFSVLCNIDPIRQENTLQLAASVRATAKIRKISIFRSKTAFYHQEMDVSTNRKYIRVSTIDKFNGEVCQVCQTDDGSFVGQWGA